MPCHANIHVWSKTYTGNHHRRYCVPRPRSSHLRPYPKGRYRKDCTCHAKRRWGHKRSWAQVTQELLGGIENIAPATQKERKTTKNFSEDTKIGSQRTSRRHRKYCTCHTKSVSVTCDSSQQASIRSGDNISEASKLLHLPRKSHGKGHKLSIGSQAIRT